MSRHLYCCQNSTQHILDHMYPVPKYFQVNPVCLYGCDESDFVDGFRCLWETVHAIYEDIIQNPEMYGLPIVEYIAYGDDGCEGYDPKAGKSHNSAKRMMGLMRVLGKAGELIEGKLEVSISLYLILLKELKPKYKITNSNMILKRLNNFGFYFSGFNGKYFSNSLINVCLKKAIAVFAVLVINMQLNILKMKKRKQKKNILFDVFMRIKSLI